MAKREDYAAIGYRAASENLLRPRAGCVNVLAYLLPASLAIHELNDPLVNKEIVKRGIIRALAIGCVGLAAAVSPGGIVVAGAGAIYAADAGIAYIRSRSIANRRGLLERFYE